MKFDTPATTNPIDQLKVVGHPVDRIDGPLKTAGTAPYTYDRHDVIANPAYGYIVGAGIAKGRIASMDMSAAEAAPGVITVVTASNAGKLGKGKFNNAPLLGGPQVDHYHQAIALVVAETFEQARAAAQLVRVGISPSKGKFDLAAAKDSAVEDKKAQAPSRSAVGDFDTAFGTAPVRFDATYTTADESHSMMEPHATIAAWDGDQLSLWTSTQMVDWSVSDMAATLKIPKNKIHLMSPYVGGGFGAKLWIRADALLAALGARAARRPVKVTLQRALIPNNTVHRAATIQRMRIGATSDGRIVALGHECWSGNLNGTGGEAAAVPSRSVYAGANRMTSNLVAELDLPEGNSMRAPGEAPGMAVIEIAMDEMAEKLGLDPIAFRTLNDTQVLPDKPGKPEGDTDGKGGGSDDNGGGKAKGDEDDKTQDDKDKNKSAQTQSKDALPNPHPPFSKRQLTECFRIGAEHFGWTRRNPKASQVRDGQWLVGMGVATAFRDNLLMQSAARVRLDKRGNVTVETDMTDIGTGSYTVIAQTAAEMMGVPLQNVVVRLGDSSFPVSCGSGGQWGGNNATAGVYAACVKLREMVARQAGLSASDAQFADGMVRTPSRSVPLGEVAGDRGLVAEDHIEYGDLDKRYQQSTFGAHFVEVGVDAYTGETRVRRMLAVCAAGRILNPKTARSQVIGAMTMGVGAALMEELVVDKRTGFFANHDLASYEVPVHADIPHQEVIFLDETDPISSPMKAKGVAELGICGVAAAVANAVYNATGVRVRDYPVTLDKLIGKMPPLT